MKRVEKAAKGRGAHGACRYLRGERVALRVGVEVKRRCEGRAKGNAEGLREV